MPPASSSSSRMNLSSIAGFGPMPYTATYAATKAFVLSFSEALAVEMSGTGVHVVCVCPGFTRTGFQEKAHIDVSFLPAFAWMSPEEVADQAVHAARRSGVLVNGAMNNLTTVFMEAKSPPVCSSCHAPASSIGTWIFGTQLIGERSSISDAT